MQKTVPTPRRLYLVLAVLLLGGCGHTPITRTVFDALPWLGKPIDNLKLDANLRYLRVTVDARVSLMVLGYIEPDPAGPIETWYSQEGEVIRLQNGRIAATSGLTTDWRAVRNYSLPGWKDMVERQTIVYRRERDEMPGYRFGIKESISLYPVNVPSSAKLVNLPTNALRWYEETVVGQPAGLPSARFGLQVKDGAPRVVYSEQCLAQDLCLTWQTWPATP
jgi:hypothetical protein